MLFILLAFEPDALCTPGQRGLDVIMHGDECMFSCQRNKKKCLFSPLLLTYLQFSLMWAFENAWQEACCDISLHHGINPANCHQNPSVYTIPRSLWNYRILWASFSFGIRLHLGSGRLEWAFDTTPNICYPCLKAFSGFQKQGLTFMELGSYWEFYRLCRFSLYVGKCCKEYYCTMIKMKFKDVKWIYLMSNNKYDSW